MNTIFANALIDGVKTDFALSGNKICVIVSGALIPYLGLKADSETDAFTILKKKSETVISLKHLNSKIHEFAVGEVVFANMHVTHGWCSVLICGKVGIKSQFFKDNKPFYTVCVGDIIFKEVPETLLKKLT